jgi:hypothetical protein
MRAPLDAARLHRVLQEIGRRCRGPGTIYVTGGASALLVGWRDSTVDLDLKLDPEPRGAFEAIAEVKEELDANVELASPDLFVPVPRDWREHSPHVARHGAVEFRHFDFRAQALAKLARDHERDVTDVRAMVERGLLTPASLQRAFEEIEPDLVRYPHLDAALFRRRVEEFLRAHRG